MPRLARPFTAAVALVLLLLSAVCAPGCAHYRVGSLMHPQVHSIAIARVANPTDEPRLGIELQDKLRYAFMQDRSLAVVDNAADADCLLTCKIVRYTHISAGGIYNQAQDRTNRAYLTNLYEVNVTVEYVVTIPGRPEPLIGTQSAIGKGDFTELGDLELTRRQAFGVALADAARRIVSGVTEAW